MVHAAHLFYNFATNPRSYLSNQVKESGFTEEDEVRSEEVSRTVDKVTKVSSKIKELATSKNEEPDSDDEDDGEEERGGGQGRDEGEEGEVGEQEMEKKKISEFEAAFKKNQFNNAIATNKEKEEKKVTAKKMSKVAAFSADYSDALFSVVIELPGVASMKRVDLQVSATKLLLAAKVEEGDGTDIALDYTFTSAIDEGR